MEGRNKQQLNSWLGEFKLGNRESVRRWFIIGIFAMLALCLSMFFVGIAQAQSLVISPNRGNYQVGQTFSVGIYVTSPEQAMNAASGVISFPTEKLSVISVSKGGSIFNLWVQEPTFSNSAGTVNFEGIVLNPGYSGQSGKLLSVTFRTKATGPAVISFSSGQVLANDGSGTNILRSLGKASINIEEQEKPTVPTPSTSDKIVPQTSIDNQPPLPFTLNFLEGDNMATATPSLVLNATDTLSGIDHYQIKIDGNDLGSVAVSSLATGSVYVLPPQTSGQHSLEVTAYDRSGNATSANRIFHIILPILIQRSAQTTTAITAGSQNFSWSVFGASIINYLLMIAIATLLIIVTIIIVLYGLIKIKRLHRELRREWSGANDHELMHALKLLNDSLELELKTLDRLSDRLKAARNDQIVNKKVSQALDNSQSLVIKLKSILGRRK